MINEPLFGSGAPIWTGMPSPGFGWPQAGTGASVVGTPGGAGPYAVQQGSPGGIATAGQGLPMGNRPTWETPASPYGVLPQSYGFVSAMPPNPSFGPTGFGIGPMVGAPIPFGMSAGFPPSIAQEPSFGLSAPAILATVAMRRGQPMGPTNDQELEEFLYDALEFLPGTNEVEVRCEGGRVILTGSVQHKRLKHDVGEIAWSIPHLSDVQNDVTIATRRRPRGAPREAEHHPTPAGRKQG